MNKVSVLIFSESEAVQIAGGYYLCLFLENSEPIQCLEVYSLASRSGKKCLSLSPVVDGEAADTLTFPNVVVVM